MDEINDATDRVIAGLEGRALADNASKKLIAYHEAGHAIVGTLLPYHDAVNKVTVIPRGQAKGLTWFTPGEDQSLISAAMLKARIAGALGGRAAEQLVFGTNQVTTGAGGDLQQVERMARAMVTQFGMSDVGAWLGSRFRASPLLPPFLRRTEKSGNEKQQSFKEHTGQIQA